MMTNLYPGVIDVESAGRFNELRVARVQSQMKLGELDMGVEALQDFCAGDVVCVGTLEAATERSTYSMTCLDHAGRPFNGAVTAPLRLINHACMPNLVMVPLPGPDVGSVCLVAIAAVGIETGDELTFAYHQTELEIIGFDQCLCSNKASPCVGAVKGWQGLDEHWKNHYRQLFAKLCLPFPAYLDFGALVGGPIQTHPLAGEGTSARHNWT